MCLSMHRRVALCKMEEKSLVSLFYVLFQFQNSTQNHDNALYIKSDKIMKTILNFFFYFSPTTTRRCIVESIAIYDIFVQ